jgi:hypothetical protein
MNITIKDILGCFKKNNKPEKLFMIENYYNKANYIFLFSDYRYVSAYKTTQLFHVTYYRKTKLFRFFEADDVFNDDVCDLNDFLWYMKQFETAYPQLKNYIRLQKLSRLSRTVDKQ